VDVRSWSKRLEGAAFAAFIPLIAKLLYKYDVEITPRENSCALLYAGLAQAIQLQGPPSTILPLDWTPGDIVSFYNNFPMAQNLYAFETAVAPFPLNHARRVVLSILIAWYKDLDQGSVHLAIQVLFPLGTDVVVLECEGRNRSHPFFSGLSVVECTSQTMWGLGELCRTTPGASSEFVKWEECPSEIF